jgi:hypothetical protein
MISFVNLFISSVVGSLVVPTKHRQSTGKVVQMEPLF